MTGDCGARCRNLGSGGQHASLGSGSMPSVEPFQVTFDCAEPERVARFWCEVLGYVVPPPPEGFAAWDDYQRSSPPEEQGSWFACVDPSGVGPRLYFQRVPEGTSPGAGVLSRALGARSRVAVLGITLLAVGLPVGASGGSSATPMLPDLGVAPIPQPLLARNPEGRVRSARPTRRDTRTTAVRRHRRVHGHAGRRGQRVLPHVRTHDRTSG